MELARCLEVIGGIAAERGISVPPGLAPSERTAVLDLARVVAHTVERSAAPLACYAVGQVVAGADPAARLDLVNALIERISAERPSE
jgi:hypothetical protein